MPRDANGAYSLPNGTLVNAGNTLRVSQHNPAMQDLAAGVSQSLSRSGQGAMQADLNLGGFKLKGGTVSARVEQLPSVTDYSSAAVADDAGGSLFVPYDVASSVPNGSALKARYGGFGQITTADGNKRGKWVSRITQRPSSIGDADNIETAFNGDWSGSHFPIDLKISGAGTLGTPTTGYLYTNEASAVFTTMENTSGHNESLTGNEGRTAATAFRTIVRNYGQGDCMAYNASAYVSGALKPGATHWLAQKAGSLFTGDISAGADHVYLNPREIIAQDNGYAVSCIGDVFNMHRTNGGSSQSETWLGYRVQSVGTVQADAAFSLTGKFRVGFDAAFDVVDISGHIISCKSGQKIGLNNASTNGFYTDVFNGDWIGHVAGSGVVIASGGAPTLQVSSTQVTVAGKLQAIGKLGSSVLPSLNFPDDSAAATGGVAIGEFYHSGGAVRVRVA